MAIEMKQSFNIEVNIEVSSLLNLELESLF